MIRHRGNIQPVTRDKRVPSGDGGGRGSSVGSEGGETTRNTDVLEKISVWCGKGTG